MWSDTPACIVSIYDTSVFISLLLINHQIKQHQQAAGLQFVIVMVNLSLGKELEVDVTSQSGAGHVTTSKETGSMNAGNSWWYLTLILHLTIM